MRFIVVHCLKSLLFYFFCCVVVLTAGTKNVLANGNSRSGELNESQIPIYSVASGRQIGTVSSKDRYNIIRREGDRLRVQFIKPTVRGWVSKDYVESSASVNSAIVRVNTDVLNFRLRPEISSERISQLYYGYQSPLLRESSRFVEVYAPASLEVLIPARQRRLTKNSSEGLFSEVESADGVAQENQEQTATISESQVQESTSSQELVHLIAPGDSLSLLVYGESDLSIENTRVDSNGEAVFPLIGAVSVSGKTTRQVTQELVSKLSQGYVLNPRISVSIASYRPIFVRGEIDQGTIEYSEGLTVTKVISLAGGLKSTGKADGISVIRNGQTVAEGLDSSSDYKILSGDIVDVEADTIAKEAETSFIYLHGEVKNAGEYLFRPGLTVEKAVVLAGGFTIRASQKKVQITRYFNVNQGDEPGVLKKVKLYEPIKPGDVIEVGASWF